MLRTKAGTFNLLPKLVKQHSQEKEQWTGRNGAKTLGQELGVYGIPGLPKLRSASMGCKIS